MVNNMVIEDIDIEVLQKNIKNINLSVHAPDGRVRLTVPEKMDEEAIKLFAISKLSWIKKQRKKFKNQTRERPRKFISGENHYLFGKRYILKVIETKSKQRVEINNNKYLNLYIRKNTTLEKREKIMRDWYRSQLRLEIPKYIEKWEKIIGVSVKDWNVRKMKTIWGSCNIQKRKILLNLELAKKNPRCLEYVVVHEMVHLLERDHNNRFKAYMDSFLPSWRTLKAELNGMIFEGK